MTEREYQYISMIAQCGNITKAAEKLFIAQPSLTQCLQRIEQDYGAKFFYRGHDGVRLTEAGEVYMAAAERMLSVYQELKREVGGEQEEQRGRISIGLEEFQAERMFADLICRYTSKFPYRELRITESTSQQLQEMVMDHKLDLILVHYPLINENLTFIPLYEDELVLAVAKDNPEYERMAKEQQGIPFITPQMMEQQQLIMFTSNQQIRTAAENICKAAGIEPKIRYTVLGVSMAIALASKGVGAAVVPSNMCRWYDSIYPSVFFRFPEEWNGAWQLAAACRNDQILDEPCRDLIEVFRKSIGGME